MWNWFLSEKAKRVLSIVAFIMIVISCILSIWGAIIYASNISFVAIGICIAGLIVDDIAMK